MSYILWLDNSEPKVNSESLVISWNSSSLNSPNISILDYVELHAFSLRKKYLSFIHELGQYEVNNKQIVSHLSEKRGYNLWWMSQIAEKTHINSPYITDCIKLFALEEVFTKNKIKSVAVYANHSQKTVYKSIHLLCSNLGINCYYKLVGDAKRISFRKIVHKIRPKWFSVIGYLLRYFLLHRKLINKRPATWFYNQSSVTIFSYFPHLDVKKCNKGEFYSTQWNLLPALLKSLKKEINWLHHFSLSMEVKTVDQGISWINSFNKNSTLNGSHAFFENHLNTTLVFRVCINYFHFYFKSLTLRNIKSAFKPSCSALDLWPMFKEDWYLSLRGGVAIRNWLFIEMVDQALKELPKQLLGLYVQENMYWERALLHSWRTHGHGNIIGVPLATINFWDLRYCEDERSITKERDRFSLPMPNKVALHGSLAKNHYINTKYPMGATVEVEALRYLYLEKRSNRASSIKKIQKNKIDVLILGEYNGDTTMELLLTVTDMPILDNVIFTLKPHPVCSTDFVKSDLINISVIIDPIDKIIDNFDAVIVARTTSAAMDVYYSGINVIVYLGEKEINLSPLREIDGVQFVRTEIELLDAICSLKNSLIHDKLVNTPEEEYFYLDNDLPRWKALIT